VIIDFLLFKPCYFTERRWLKEIFAIVTALSTYPAKTVVFLKNLAQKTRIPWSPNITLGINFLMPAAKILKTFALYTDIELMKTT
jgi:4-hydroxy-tetrahydrodipicolinate reductase